MAEQGAQQYIPATTGNAANTLATKTTHLKYFRRYLETAGIEDTLPSLVRQAKDGKDQDVFKFLNDPKTYQDFGGYLIDGATQLSDPTKPLSADHAKNIFSTITTTVSEAFPDHPTWQKNAFQTWCSGARDAIEKRIQRKDITKGQSNSEWKEAITTPILKQFNRAWHLLGTPMACMYSLMVTMSVHAIARSGEFAFTTLDKGGYSPTYDTLSLMWREIKEMKQYRLYFYTGTDMFNCVLWAWSGMLLAGCPAGVCKPTMTAPSGASKGIFPKFFEKAADASEALNVAVKHGASLVSELAEKVDLYIGKSCRYGGVASALTWPAFRLNPFPAISQGNWSWGCRMLEYAGDAALGPTRATASKALAGYDDPFSNPPPPRLIFLETASEEIRQKWNKVIVFAYSQHEPDLGPDRRCSDVGRLLLAVELMRMAEGYALNPDAIRYKSLAECAIKAGFGEGKTRSQLMQFLIDAGKPILNEWRLRTTLDAAKTGGTEVLVTNVVQIQRENIELRKVRFVALLVPYFYFFRDLKMYRPFF